MKMWDSPVFCARETILNFKWIVERWQSCHKQMHKLIVNRMLHRFHKRSLTRPQQPFRTLSVRSAQCNNHKWMMIGHVRFYVNELGDGHLSARKPLPGLAFENAFASE